MLKSLKISQSGEVPRKHFSKKVVWMKNKQTEKPLFLDLHNLYKPAKHFCKTFPQKSSQEENYDEMLETQQQQSVYYNREL